ncbi:hypothetical protein FY036_12690 [Mesorhizobium microcysteis]|uniref:DUF1353 domain-containing protein n=1 Tax=Neoaquamicrobium microcysteis TaxID=2682781 RepID=A0A5D4GXF2_9HYPH|nr:hypothetical protein [Mesorhizobium microcysteis]TYR31945.1 hypothetical protein FY036_12690 [Mesorhizobium microcysteis]
MRRTALFLICLFGLWGCSTPPPRVDPNDPGIVSGKLMVFWDGEDRFVYFPYYDDPLVYTLPKHVAQRLGVTTIRPGAIYTDGGSIPRAVRGVVGFSPWGYGPAYIVHDWLFVAHHCIVHDGVGTLDRRDHDEAEKVRNVDFPMSADILGGIIQALIRQEKVPPRALAPDAIYGAVDSFVAKGLWDNDDPRSCKPVPPNVIAGIEESLRRPQFDGQPESGRVLPRLVYVQDF